MSLGEAQSPGRITTWAKGHPCPQLEVFDPVPSLPCPKTASHEELGILLSSQHPKPGLGVPPAFLHRPIQLCQLFSEPARLQLVHGMVGVRPMQAFSFQGSETHHTPYSRLMLGCP